MMKTATLSTILLGVSSSLASAEGSVGAGLRSTRRTTDDAPDANQKWTTSSYDDGGSIAHGSLHNDGGENDGDSPNRARATGEITQDDRYWMAPIEDGGLTCIDNSIRAGGEKPLSTCIREGEAICIDYAFSSPLHPMGGRWMFGVKDDVAKLWNPRMEVVWEFCVAMSHICVGEEHGYALNRYSLERPYLYFYNEKTDKIVGRLNCDGTDGQVRTGITCSKPSHLLNKRNANANNLPTYFHVLSLSLSLIK